MASSPVSYYFLLANLITSYYGTLRVLDYFNTCLSNPFHDIFALQPMTVKPAQLSDPKYGEHKFITANNVSLHYVDSGDASKPMMLFLHGFPEIWYTWRYQIMEFNKDFRCIGLDMRGFGESSKPDGVDNYQIDIVVEDIYQLITQLGYSKFILVSHDWGGIVAARYRDTHPDTLNALVLVSSTSLEAWYRQIWTTAEQRRMSGYVFLHRLPKFSEMRFVQNNISAFESFMLVKGKDTVTEQDVLCFKYYFSQPNAFTPPINYYRANFLYNIPKIVQHTENVPFLALLGSIEPWLSTTLLDVMKKQYATIETQIVPGVRHFMHQEDPVIVNGIIRDFFARNNLTATSS